MAESRTVSRFLLYLELGNDSGYHPGGLPRILPDVPIWLRADRKYPHNPEEILGKCALFSPAGLWWVRGEVTFHDLLVFYKDKLSSGTGAAGYR